MLVFVLGSLLRVDLRRLGQGLRQWRLSLLPPLWLMLMLPLTVGLLARAVGLDPALSLALLLAAAAPPSSGNAAIARMLGLDADAALLVTLIATALAPVSVPLLLWLLAPPELALPGTALARQIGLLLGAAIALALLWRGLAGAARRGCSARPGPSMPVCCWPCWCLRWRPWTGCGPSCWPSRRRRRVCWAWPLPAIC
ncbi:hypothetical protein [Paucibacter sp. M5-1]|uniref:hypothetical protein n=1 Tax=Paucibacter sp. M5-1 TaxID=3015998 RepID=UPI0022B8FA5C|nr:hypothetical protein [Paucibacter sp. M5-1]MCZ7883539.1 hypothetical protein [Paucibacter sp. M5-1]